MNALMARRTWPPAAKPGARKRSVSVCLAVLSGALLIALLVGAATGAYAITPAQLAAIAWHAIGWSGAHSSPPDSSAAPQELVFVYIRLPRLLFGLFAGAALGLAGALMQGLMRNPLADPALIGVSSGAACAAAAVIVLGAWWWPALPRALGSLPLVAAAFAGGLGAAALIQAWAQVEGRTRLALMLLAGIAINALAGAGIGWLSASASDEQLRSIQFWLLGSLAAARWPAVAAMAALCMLGLAAAWPLARGLNALALGENVAHSLGVSTESLKRRVVLISALVVSAVSATAGVIGFIGLIAPHIVRLLAGPDHRVVLPGSALLGATLTILADAVARSVVAPAELPLGVVTALIGAPLFLLLLRQERHRL